MLILFTACPTKRSAQKIAEKLVLSNLAACATYFPSSSIFYWKGKLQKRKEFILEAKLASKNYGAAESLILSLHKDNIPQIFAVKPSKVLSSYKRWADGATVNSKKILPSKGKV